MSFNRVSSAVGVTILFVFGALLATGSVPADASDGTLACGGTNLRLSGGDETYSTYRLDNFNEEQTILIERILVYSNDGRLVCAFPDADPLPPRFKTVLGPHEYSVLTTYNMHTAGCLPEPLSPGNPLAVPGVSAFIEWSFESQKGNDLRGVYTDSYKQTETDRHVGRSSVLCLEIQSKQK